MDKVKIGILREGKIPIDRRVPLTPVQAKEVETTFPSSKVLVQSSGVRCFLDSDYLQAGVEVTDDLSDCDILLGVKEVPIDALIPTKTYLFFSHTIKEQSYNRELLRSILHKKISLIDYETLTDGSGRRLIAFGRFAGIVGAYNGILAFGKRTGRFQLKPAYQCQDLADLETEFSKVNLPNIKIVVTGTGRVARGAIETLSKMGIKQVHPTLFLEESFNTAVFTTLASGDYNKKSDGSVFDELEFYSSPEVFEGDFLKYAMVSDLLVAAAYWDPRAPVLFTRENMLDEKFRIKLIADITCDIQGSIPSTIRPSLIEDPLYDYDPTTGKEKPALSSNDHITVMAVDNLPCEVPRDSSESFGRQLIDNILPSLLEADAEGIIERAQITVNGTLTPNYDYLQNYVDGVS